MDATTISVDLAKSVFEVAVADRNWRIVGRHRLTRPQFERLLRTTSPMHVVMEACGTSHSWARLVHLRQGLGTPEAASDNGQSVAVLDENPAWRQR